MSPEEYLASERAAPYRSEYLAGEVFAIAGASEAHDLICGDIFAAIRTRQRPPCRTYTSNMKVYLAEPRRFCYPDVTVCCDSPVFRDEVKDTLLNPTVVVEVLSAGTMSYDLGDKSFFYRQPPSLRHLVIVWQDRVRIAHWFRDAADAKWMVMDLESTSKQLSLQVCAVVLSLSEIYETVSFST